MNTPRRSPAHEQARRAGEAALRQLYLEGRLPPSPFTKINIAVRSALQEVAWKWRTTQGR